MAATKDGNLYLVLSEEDTSMAGLKLGEGEDKELSSDLALIPFRAIDVITTPPPPPTKSSR